MPWPVSKDWLGVAEAVSFLWHWPSMGFEAHVPDVIRHTALRSSDFPPPGAPRFSVKCPAATARSSCQLLVYPGSELGVPFGMAPHRLLNRVPLGARLFRQSRIGFPL